MRKRCEEVALNQKASDTMARSCIIIGGGISGASSALTLSQLGIQCSLYELRDQPATIGGSINLTPNAISLLESIGVELKHGCKVDVIDVYSITTGYRLGEVSFRRSGHSLRIMREHLQGALLEAVKAAGIPTYYGSKLKSIEDASDSAKITAVFSDGRRAHADFILGCDGVHSAVRTVHIEPDRRPIYTGVAAAYAVVDADGVPAIHFKSSAANAGRSGTLITSFIEENRKKIFLSAGMQAPEERDREGWKSRGQDHEATMEEVHRRYKDSVIPSIIPLIEKVKEFIFYPIYKLGPEGTWSKGRVLLLGDAAHGVGQ
jgi:salicylate hydroxylase